MTSLNLHINGIDLKESLTVIHTWDHLFDHTTVSFCLHQSHQ